MHIARNLQRCNCRQEDVRVECITGTNKPYYLQIMDDSTLDRVYLCGEEIRMVYDKVYEVSYLCLINAYESFEFIAPVHSNFAQTRLSDSTLPFYIIISRNVQKGLIRLVKWHYDSAVVNSVKQNWRCF